MRNNTKRVRIGDIYIGGNSPILVQSMTNTDTRDADATIKQIKLLEEAGCDIVRVAVPDKYAADALLKIKKNIRIPLVADIHFDFRLALASIKNGADKVRLNPGNIRNVQKLQKIAYAAKERQIPIRIGVNSGSLEKEILEKYGIEEPEGMVESALRYVRILEDFCFEDIIISMKSSSVVQTIQAYRLIAQRTKYPLHIGITEVGTLYNSLIKSSVGIGALLAEGIGDTLRVSITGDHVEEVKAGIGILKALELRKGGLRLVSCPTCGRCKNNLIEIVNEIEAKTQSIDKNITIAIMGCIVNGPGEARHADIGIAGGIGEFLLFKKGQVIRKIPSEFIVDVLLDEIAKFQ